MPTLDDTPVLLASGQSYSVGMATHDGFLYWTSAPSGAEGPGKVHRMSVAGGAVKTIADNQTAPSSIVVDSSGVYWTNRHAHGAVMRVDHEGGEPETIAADQNGAHGLAVDTTRLYWTNTEAGQVMMVSK